MKKIVFVGHMYPFKVGEKSLGLAGGELYCHRLLKLLQSHNYEVGAYVCKIKDKLFSTEFPMEWVYEDINVKQVETVDDIEDIYDIYITHLDMASEAIKLAVKRGKMCYFVSHNGIKQLEVIKNESVRVIYNCNNTRKNLMNYEDNDGFTMIPILERKKYEIDTDPFKREYITIVNSIPSKGGDIFRRISERMPDDKFLVVEGGYYQNQAVTKFSKNVTVMKQTSNMIDVYKKTKILLYPSYLETFGMCASEAMCSGIPVICFNGKDTKGLCENVGNSGIFVYNNDNIGEWINLITQLKNESLYRKVSERCLKRSEEQDISKHETNFIKWFNEKPQYKLGILVIGCQKYIADTYYQLDILNELFPEATIRAIIGGSKNCYLKDDIYYCDVLDDYENLPLKVKHGLSLDCFNDCTHIMKIDDDIFIKNINPIKIQLSKPEKYNHYCAPVIGNTKQFKKINEVRLSKCSNPNVNRDIPANVKFCFGGLYILSKSSVDILLREDEKFNTCIMEDIVVGSILNAHKIEPVGFECYIMERPRLKLKNKSNLNL